MSDAGLAGADAAIARELVRRIHAGDRAAEGELVERYSRGVLHHLRRMTGDPARSDDLHQETFRVVLLRLRTEGLEQPEKLAGFLLGTARNLFLGQHRKRVRRGEDREPPAVDLPDPRPGQLARVLEEEEARAVQGLIAELGTDRDRELLLRFYVAEEDKERICGDLGLTSLHFNRVLFRARQRFKELLESRGFGPVRQSDVSRQSL
jgi:RNA polymerase sigma-70 factor (ECF subfamily)